jgi:Protein of unknown function (DUF3237)
LISARLPGPSLTRAYRLEAPPGEPLDPGDIAQRRSRILPLTGGTFAGPDPNEKLLPGSSADRQTALPDRTAPGDIRHTPETDEGILHYARSRSMRHRSADVLDDLFQRMPAEMGRGRPRSLCDEQPGHPRYRTVRENR